MKRIIVFAAALLALAACSVDKQDFMPEVTLPESELITITATQNDGPQTRTILDKDLIHVLWMPYDEINLFYQEQNACFTSINTYEPTAIAQFQGQMTIDVVTGGNEGGDMETSYFWGLYPYSKDARYDMGSGTIETYLPEVQTAAPNSFADDLFITIGRSTSWNMPFYNVCSGLRFTVDQEGITSVVLRSNGDEPLAGRFRVGMDEETERPVVQGFEYGIPEVRLLPPEGEPWFMPDTYYYIVTLPGTLEYGFTLELEGLPNPARVSTENPITFTRSRFIPTALTADRYYADFLPLDHIDLNIENEGVQRYLEDVDYSYDLVDYRDSYIQQYISFGTDKPNPVVFNWKSTSSRWLTVTDPENEDIVFSGDASDYTTEVYNLVPGKTYAYHVDGDYSWDSSFTPEGTLRMISMDGVRNVRDLGGWQAGDKRIRYGKIYRGAQLNNISGQGREVFGDLGIMADIDLRGNDAVNTMGLEDYYRFPVTYLNINGTSGQYYIEAIRRIIILLEEGKTVYFHCMVGADRTGTLAFLLEALLGVSESDLSKDFELTSFSPELRTRNGNGGGQQTAQFALWRLTDDLHRFPGDSIQDKVTYWATTGENALTMEEVEELKALLLE